MRNTDLEKFVKWHRIHRSLKLERPGVGIWVLIKREYSGKFITVGDILEFQSKSGDFYSVEVVNFMIEPRIWYLKVRPKSGKIPLQEWIH